MSNVMLYIVLGAILAPSNLCAPHGSTSREQAAASKIGQEGTTVDDGTVNNEEVSFISAPLQPYGCSLIETLFF